MNLPLELAVKSDRRSLHRGTCQAASAVLSIYSSSSLNDLRRGAVLLPPTNCSFERQTAAANLGAGGVFSLKCVASGPMICPRGISHFLSEKIITEIALLLSITVAL